MEALGAHARLTMTFQPILAVTRQPPAALAMEALARGPAGTPYECPAALFAAARQAGTVEQLDRLCVQQALADAALAGAGLPLFLNVHPATLRDDLGFPSFLVASAWRSGIAPERLTVEILEHVRAGERDSGQILAALAVLRAVGVRIAVDDVSGPADALRAEAFAPDYYKLDAALLHDARHDVCARDLIRAITQRAGADRVIAEGVEDATDLEIVRGAGITMAQGFFLGRPAPAAADDTVTGAAAPSR
jgi:EAL domain-containing protein (putative c-di-GMP-specific phosphodiesterase class I)